MKSQTKTHTVMLRKIIISCFLAICIEMYDFSIFVFFAPTIQKKYLSFTDHNSALFMTYLFFAIGFICRPLGSLVFGYIGDHYGRKYALIISIALMGFSSLIIAILPSYNTIGMASCYILIFIRILQGISVGGEYSGAIIYSIEQFNVNKTGIISGIVVCGSVCGTFLAILSSNILQSNLLPEYSWRLAFLLGFSLAFIGYFIRRELSETPEFKRYVQRKHKIPLIEGIQANWIKCIATIFISGAKGVNFHFILVFMPNYINSTLNTNISDFR